MLCGDICLYWIMYPTTINYFPNFVFSPCIYSSTNYYGIRNRNITTTISVSHYSTYMLQTHYKQSLEIARSSPIIATSSHSLLHVFTDCKHELLPVS